jgi:predicted N-acyltransferase
LVWADIGGVPVAGALNLISDEALIGRNWGTAGRFPFLHFECCYYQAIEFAIERGLSRVEAGTQGPHKVQRGYLPSPTWSAHWVASSGFRDAIENFLDEEKRAIEREMAMWMRHSPYRSTEHDPPPERDTP